jgi:pyridoxine 5-phosphate synthase
MSKKIRLGVNIDHIATLRQLRGQTTAYPDVQYYARQAVLAGAEQITVHLREDRRHIQDQDVVKLCHDRPTTINLEMAVTPSMIKFAKKHKPDWCCFVPEKRQELTTEGGLDVVKSSKKIAIAIEALQSKNMEVSLFIDPNLKQVRASFMAGADAIEFHTGHWVLAQGQAKKRLWKQLCEAALLAHQLGMGVHAGHGLDREHCRLISNLPHLREVNIGHSLVCYALEKGFKYAVQDLKRQLQKK